MSTLYIRDVPEEVAATLRQRAAAEGQSLSAYVGALLSQSASRPTNAEIAEKLARRSRPAGPTRDQILQAVDSARP